jgi:hypothetical protein
MEASFYMSAAALRHIQPGLPPDEAALLSAFDLNRNLIYAAATKVYARRSKGSYDLVASDF